MQTESPAAAYFPAGHNAHTVEAVAATVLENVPAGHDTQTLAPETPAYAPAKQLMHMVEDVAATVVEYLPATHAVQTVAPVSPYLPA